MEQTILTLIRGLDKNKYQHHIICTWKGGPVAEALEKEGVEITAIGSFRHPFEWSKYRQVLKIIRSFQPHILHGAVFEGMSMAAIGSFFGNVPLTIFEETSDPQNRSKMANFLLRIMSSQADALQAISSNVGKYLKEKTGIKPEKIRIIPNGVQVRHNPIKEDVFVLRDGFSISSDKFIIGFVGRLFDDHKRVSDLIKAIFLLNNKEIIVLIIGEGKDKNELISLAKSLDILDQFIFVGYQPETSSFYELMNVLVIPSAREGFGLVAAEAMLHGLPVIATQVGGLQDIVIDGETGFLVDAYSPDQIAAKINHLIQNPKLCHIMGEKGRQRALENYTAERYCREVEKLYLELLEKKGIGY
ncbi:glycosyltransferase family 4 protein [Algoriphagus faecimaris]|uniref:glycosyltransferase family 4 protein n=1 Tax=Algoriphagus faecimaris TaxID=686796 RepID=UPI001F0AAA9A|nr:glycosyltransferase family 4 protein [Algoriphagus faecimaris]